MTHPAVALPLCVALIAVQAVNEQLQLMRARAACDARWAPEVARVEGARRELDEAINAALGEAGTCPGCGLQLAHCSEAGRSSLICLSLACGDE